MPRHMYIEIDGKSVAIPTMVAKKLLATYDDSDIAELMETTNRIVELSKRHTELVSKLVNEGKHSNRTIASVAGLSHTTIGRKFKEQ